MVHLARRLPGKVSKLAAGQPKSYCKEAVRNCQARKYHHYAEAQTGAALNEKFR